MEVIGEAVLSAAVEFLFEKLKSADFVQFATGGQVAKILKNRESKLRLIRAVLDDAEEKQVTNQAVKIWLAKLRDLAFDVGRRSSRVSKRVPTTSLVKETKVYGKGQGGFG